MNIGSIPNGNLLFPICKINLNLKTFVRLNENIVIPTAETRRALNS